MFLQHRLFDNDTWRKFSAWLIFVGIAFTPFSSSIDNLITIGALLTLFHGELAQHWQMLKARKLTWLTLALILCLAIGVFYTSAGSAVGLHQLKKYGLKLIAFLCLIPFFMKAQHRRYGTNALIFSGLLAALINSLHIFHIIDLVQVFHKPADHVIAPLQLAIILGTVIWVLINRILDEKPHRLFHMAACIGLLSYQLYINMERTGVVITVLLLGLCCWQRLPRRWMLLSFIVIPLIASSVYVTSPQVSQRFNQAIDEAVHHDKAGYKYTSIGLRIAFAKHSYDLIIQRPWFGHGTGSFATEYTKTGGPQLSANECNLGDPHNSYLHLAVQIGLVGLAVFLLWLACQWRDSLRMSLADQRLGQGALLVFATANCLVAAFVLNQPCFVFLTFMAMAYGGWLGQTQQ